MHAACLLYSKVSGLNKRIKELSHRICRDSSFLKKFQRNFSDYIMENDMSEISCTA